MKKQQVIIKKETNPNRCDICHQSDLFNPVSGDCQRCVGQVHYFAKANSSLEQSSIGKSKGAKTDLFLTVINTGAFCLYIFPLPKLFSLKPDEMTLPVLFFTLALFHGWRWFEEKTNRRETGVPLVFLSFGASLMAGLIGASGEFGLRFYVLLFVALIFWITWFQFDLIRGFFKRRRHIW